MPAPDECPACEILRACEQRVRMEDDDYAYVAAQAEAEGRRRGWAEALDAAREAVKNLRHSDDCYYAEGVLCHCEIKPALAAIDALREKP